MDWSACCRRAAQGLFLSVLLEMAFAICDEGFSCRVDKGHAGYRGAILPGSVSRVAARISPARPKTVVEVLRGAWSAGK